MALKPHQKVICDDINFRCETVAEQGYLVLFNKTSKNVKKTNDVASTGVAGVLLQDVVAGIHPSNIKLGDDTGTINLARNFQKNQTYVSGVVRLLKQGEIVTNAVSGSFGVGETVRVMAGGKFRVGGAGQVVGTALSAADTDGYVKIYVNISG